MSLQHQQQAEENNENCTGTSNWTLNASANSSSRASTVCCGGNDGDELLLLKEMKLKMETLEAKNQMLEGKVENLELKAENRALKEEAAQQANNAALEEKMKQLKDEFSTILGSLEEKHGKEIAELKKANDQLWKHVTMVSEKSVLNPKHNGWNGTKRRATISSNGLGASNDTIVPNNVTALKAFGISVEQCRMDHFLGTILYYFEVTQMTESPNRVFHVGLTDGDIPDCIHFPMFGNTYSMTSHFDWYILSGKQHYFEWPNEAIKPEWNGIGDVVGCGIFRNPADKLFIFFTANGTLMGKQIPINTSVDCLYPTVEVSLMSVEANFGENLLAKPFKYDIDKCPGLVFE